MGTTEFLKKIAAWVGFLLLMYPFVLIYDIAYNFFRVRFPEAYAVWLRLLAMALPCVLLGLLIYYGAQSVRAFREGVREGRCRKL